MQGNRLKGEGGTVQSITTTQGQSEIVVVPYQLAVKLEPFAKPLYF